MAKPGVKQPEVNGSGTRGQKVGFGRWDFVKLAPLMGGFSALATVISLLVIFGKGFNYGIDFAGGTEVQVKFAQKVDASELRKFTESIGLKNTSVQALGDQNEFLVRMESVKVGTDKQNAEAERGDVKKLTDGMKAKYQLDKDGIRRIDSVGPQVGSELKRNGLLAAFYSFLVILIYVAIRFDYKYAPGAVVCLVHDSIFTLGIFAILGREVNVQIMAAVLTLIGYSLNDTIVTYDRIRETYPHYRDRGLKFIINKAVNDMLGRTILTAGCTLMAVTSLYLLGGGVISDIGFTLVIGILIGTYSSVYVAAPLILVMDAMDSKKPKTSAVPA